MKRAYRFIVVASIAITFVLCVLSASMAGGLQSQVEAESFVPVVTYYEEKPFAVTVTFYEASPTPAPTSTPVPTVAPSPTVAPTPTALPTATSTAEALPTKVVVKVSVQKVAPKQVASTVLQAKPTADVVIGVYEDCQLQARDQEEKFLENLTRRTDGAIPVIHKPLAGSSWDNFGDNRICPDGTVVIHQGNDYARSIGTSVMSAGAGQVIFIGALSIRGDTVVIYHGAGVATVYAHLNSIAVVTGQKIDDNIVIGTVGETGVANGPNLHFEVRVAGIPVHP